MQNYFYSSVAAIALVVHLIINWRELFEWRNVSSRAGAWEFRHFVLCLLVFFSADFLWGVFEALKWPRVLYADTLTFFVTMALSVYAWSCFIGAYLEMDEGPRRRLRWMGRGALAFFLGALAANFFTGRFFTIDAQGVYTAGPMRQLAFWLLAAYNVLGSAVTLFKLRGTTGAIRRRNKMVFTFGVVMTAAILFQLGDPFLPLYGLGCLFGCCLMHVFVVEDTRDEIHRQELIARDYEAQFEAERSANQAKSLFFSTVSHDIRTPLNAILGFSELLESGEVGEAERARYISSIRSSGKVLARLVDDILDLSKIESGKLEIIKEPTDIPLLAREVIAACEVVRQRKSLVLQADIDEEMPLVRVDPQRVRQLLFNLLSNAYKYTAQGTITVRVVWRDGTLTLSVADTGKGISQEDIERILQPFVQVADKNHRDGTGLGLAICQRLATLMGGELKVESEVGVGSTFTITLHNIEAVDPSIVRAEHVGGPARAEQLRLLPARVLVVDDSPVNRAVLKAMLARCGVEDVAMAGNGREALVLLKGGAHYDLVLSDLWMPEMDGRALVHAIRADAKLAGLPVYLVTADVEARSQAESDGFTGVLLKPITLDGLRAVLG
jgi:signal transduction histidine kinase